MTLKEFYDEVQTWEVVNGFYRIQDSRPYRNHIQNCMNLNLMEFHFHKNIAVCKILKEYNKNYEKANTVVRDYIKVKRSDKSQETNDKAVELFKIGYSKKEIGDTLNITHVFLTKILENNFTAEERKKHKIEQMKKNKILKLEGEMIENKNKLIETYGEDMIAKIVHEFNSGTSKQFIKAWLKVGQKQTDLIVSFLFTPEEIEKNKQIILKRRAEIIFKSKNKKTEENEMADINKYHIEVDKVEDKSKCLECQNILNKKDETITELKELNDKLSTTIEDVKIDTTPENIKKFKTITNRMIELYTLKNKKYGNSFSKTFKEYGKLAVCLRIDDKMSRLKQMILRGESDTADESILDTLIDIANYSVMSIVELENEKKEA